MDLFADRKAEFKFSMHHDRGVNWIALSDTHVYAVDDDHLIKIWKYNNERGWEVASLAHHKQSISCITMMPQHHDLFVTCGEDGQIALWDTEKKSMIKSFQLNYDNLWFVASHPNRNLLALAHDSGFIVFKLYRERPSVYCMPIPESNDFNIFYIQYKNMFKHSTHSHSDTMIAKLKLRT